MELKASLFTFLLTIVVFLRKLYIPGILFGLITVFFLIKENDLSLDSFKTTVEPFPQTNDLNGDLPPVPITKNDPYRNNVDSDALKNTPELSAEQQQLVDAYAHQGFFTDVSNFGYKTMDRIMYTTPPDDQAAFVEFLGYNVKRDNLEPKYTDLRQSRRDYDILI